MPSATFTDSRFRLDYSVSTVRQEIENNRSLVRRVLKIVKTGSSYAWSNNTSYWSSSGPNSQSGTFTYNFGNYSSLTLMDRQDWVAHNADGTKSFSSSASVSADTPLGSASIGSFTVTLATIPRATTPTVSGGFTTGTAATINLPRASSSFTHDVTYKIGSLTGTIATGAGTSASWTPPHTLMTALPNAASGTVEITVVTKNGSTSIGSKKINVSLTAAASIVPTISGVSWEDVNSTVVTNIGAFVQGVSLVKGTVTAAGVHGSSITSKRILLGGQSFTDGTAFLVNGSGTVTAQGEATDSRGRTTTVNSSFTVLPYLPPQIGANGWQVRRANSSNVPDDNGQYLRVDLHAIASSLKPASTEKNALTITVRTKASDAGWVSRNTITPGLTHNTAFQVSGGAAFLTTKSYEVEITITDKTGAPAVVLKTTVGTAVVTLDLNGDKVGIGKMHEFGTLDVAGDIYSSGNIYSSGTLFSDGVEATDGTINSLEVDTLHIAGVQNGGYIYVDTIYFTANDSFEKADYPNVRAIRVRVQGAGGGGGSAHAATSGQSSAGQGGGGGGYAESFITDLDSLPSSVPITIGAGGVPGGTGGSSSFGDITVATGGGGGWTKPNTPYAMYVPGGPGGIGTAGDLLISGGGGGCGSAHATLCTGGSGGSSQLGGGGQSRGTGAGSGGETGSNGGLYGGGGSGASANSGSTARTGGTGAPGIVILELYR